MAHRVQYSHNKRVQLGDGGKVTITAPIDISLGTETHSEYFASERKIDQIKDLRTYHWEMDDAWWAAAQHFSYSKPKKLKGAEIGWLDKIKASHCGHMTASDGASLDSFTKKGAPHFDQNWQSTLQNAVKKGSGRVENTEEARRAEIAEQQMRDQSKREKRGAEESARLNSIEGASSVVLAWLPGEEDDSFTIEKKTAIEQGYEWRELTEND